MSKRVSKCFLFQCLGTKKHVCGVEFSLLHTISNVFIVLTFFSNSKQNTITIGPGSCTNYRACRGVGSGLSTSVIIDGGSCTGRESCEAVGQRRALSVTINGGSCLDGQSCHYVGYNTASSITINGGSCTGVMSCRNVGATSATSVNIGSASCTTAFTGCRNCGQNFAGPVTIPDNYPSGCPY